MNLPIKHEYRAPLELDALMAGGEAMEIRPHPGFCLGNEYHRKGLPAALPQMYARKAVIECLKKAAHILSPHYNLWLFDTFRSTDTQRNLFERIYSEIAGKHPSYSKDEIWAETRRYVAHPEEISRFAISPHNSGGAVDLTLAKDGVPLLLGTQFDEPIEAARTDYFEREHDSTSSFSEEEWVENRSRRRLLFHAMKEAGFTNYDEEWWHYDLGNCLWAQWLGRDWIYGSMEQEVRELCEAYIV